MTKQRQAVQVEDVLSRLRSLANPGNVAGMARFGIDTTNSFGIAAPVLHKLALDLARTTTWRRNCGTPAYTRRGSLPHSLMCRSRSRKSKWSGGCATSTPGTSATIAAVISSTRRHSPTKKAVEWSAREAEYVKRAAFALMAYLAVHDKKASDDRFLDFLLLIKRESGDDRKFVRKAVNWALRQIGKRNAALNAAAIEAAQEIRATNTRSGRWIASDAWRELTGEAVQKRLLRSY